MRAWGAWGTRVHGCESKCRLCAYHCLGTEQHGGSCGEGKAVGAKLSLQSSMDRTWAVLTLLPIPVQALLQGPWGAPLFLCLRSLSHPSFLPRSPAHQGSSSRSISHSNRRFWFSSGGSRGRGGSSYSRGCCCGGEGHHTAGVGAECDRGRKHLHHPLYVTLPSGERVGELLTGMR